MLTHVDSLLSVTYHLFLFYISRYFVSQAITIYNQVLFCRFFKFGFSQKQFCVAVQNWVEISCISFL